MNQAVFDVIVQAVSAILSERGEPVPELEPESPISESGLDSLDIATLTIRLEEQLGGVPEDALREYPQTLGALASLYGRYVNLLPASEVPHAVVSDL
jgi:acyl carrier protein